MIPLRQAQPYRRGPRQPGAPLVAMLAGRPLFLPNPQQPQRDAQRLAQGAFVRAMLFR